MHGLEEEINEKMFATRLRKILELFFNLNFISYFKQKKLTIITLIFMRRM